MKACTCWNLFFLPRARCLSAGLRSWGLLADQQGIEPPPAVCQRRQERRPYQLEPRGHLACTCWTKRYGTANMSWVECGLSNCHQLTKKTFEPVHKVLPGLDRHNFRTALPSEQAQLPPTKVDATLLEGTNHQLLSILIRLAWMLQQCGNPPTYGRRNSSGA